MADSGRKEGRSVEKERTPHGPKKKWEEEEREENTDAVDHVTTKRAISRRQRERGGEREGGGDVEGLQGRRGRLRRRSAGHEWSVIEIERR